MPVSGGIKRNASSTTWQIWYKRKPLIQKLSESRKPLGYVFSHASFAHTGDTYKHPSAVSRQLLTWSRTRSTLPAMRNDLSLLNCDYQAVKRKTKRKRTGAAQAASAFSFFACLKTTPPFENDSADRAHYCALRRNSVSPQDRFLEAWFSLFLRADTGSILQGIRTAWSPRHSFRLRCAPCGTVVPLKVTLGKNVVLPRFITLYFVT